MRWLCLSIAAGSQALAETDLPAQPYDIYLLVGQSNMAGRGDTAEDDRKPVQGIVVFNATNSWVVQGEPIHSDKPEAGVGPGFTFAKLMIEANPHVIVGLVPCAVGGSSIDRWKPGGDLFESAVRRARLAMKSGRLRGILWHQGEDASGSKVKVERYAADLVEVVQGFRRELGVPEVPFISGEVGEFLYSHAKNWFPYAREVNRQINSLSTSVEHYAVVSSEGLKDKGDQIHFDAASQKELGKRYFQALHRMESQP